MFFSLPILSDLSAPSQSVPTEDLKSSKAPCGFLLKRLSHLLKQLDTVVFLKSNIPEKQQVMMLYLLGSVFTHVVL